MACRATTIKTDKSLAATNPPTAMYLFYVPHIAQDCVLSEEESQHCVKVLRLTTGDTILLTDGVGHTYTARITNPHLKRCEFEILTKERQAKHPFRLHIAIAPTKNIERLEWMIEKCTEIGVDAITPTLCRFSERKIIKPERLEKLMISAAKQSLKSFVPTLNPMVTLSELMQAASETQRFIAHCYNGEKQLLQKVVKPGGEVLVLIGPEGDFSEQEVEQALAAGFMPVSLGNSRLRTETAGVVACHTVMLCNETE